MRCLSVLTLCSVLCAIKVNRAAPDSDMMRSSVVPQVGSRALKQVESYTSGYLRAEYKDTTLSSDKFVQATVDTIGLCYQFQLNAPQFQMLTKATLDSESNRIQLYYSNYSNSHCNGVADGSYVRTQRIRYNVFTTNNVKLRVRTIWTPTLAVGLRILPANARGIQVS